MGRISYPWGKIDASLSELPDSYEQLDPNEKIIIHCRSGKRSLKACQLLSDEGYQDLTNVEGGILAWIDEDYETNKD